MNSKDPRTTLHNSILHKRSYALLLDWTKAKVCVQTNALKHNDITK